MLVVSFTLPARGHCESNFCALQRKLALKNSIKNRIAWFFFGQNCAKRQAKPARDRACKVEGVVYLRETSQRLNSHPRPSIELCPAPFLGMTVQTCAGQCGSIAVCALFDCESFYNTNKTYHL
jgi:hypothetical protein